MKPQVFLFLFSRRTQTHSDALILQVSLLNPSSRGNYIKYIICFVSRTSSSGLEEEGQGFHLREEACLGSRQDWAPQLRSRAFCGGGEVMQSSRSPVEGTLGRIYLLVLFVLPLRIPTAGEKEAGGPSFLEGPVEAG